MITFFIVLGLLFLLFLGWPLVEILLFLAIEVVSGVFHLFSLMLDSLFQFLTKADRKTLATLGGCTLLILAAAIAALVKLVIQQK